MLKQPQISNQMEIFLLVLTGWGGDSSGCCLVLRWLGGMELAGGPAPAHSALSAGHRGHGEGQGDVHDHADGTCALMRRVIETTLI